jgi:lipopolysaccharide transport system ATP-binding protein
MTRSAINVEGLWKEYVVGKSQQTHSTIYDVVSSAIRAPFKRLRELRGDGSDVERFWALRDVNFEIQPGEVVGVVGRNGAGKSTLLKTLSRITPPTRGRLTIVGRLASLLEVGTGFHPELTGRENIFLNGAILGMTRGEMASKFDDIVAFAEIDKFIDTPVKRYSSGMYVRLAFAVAAHLETEVLLVDEVLAVGDAAFQRKSLGKMGEVASAGRTVFLVSHNLAAVRSLCSRVLLFDKGLLAFDGPVNEGLSLYERSCAVSGKPLEPESFRGSLSDDIAFDRLIYKQDGSLVELVDPQHSFQIELYGRARRAFPKLNLKIAIVRDGFYLGSCHDAEPDSPMSAGHFTSVFQLPGKVFRPGRYSLGVGASASMGSWLWGADVAVLDFAQNRGDLPDDRSDGVIAIPHSAQRMQPDPMAVAS